MPDWPNLDAAYDAAGDAIRQFVGDENTWIATVAVNAALAVIEAAPPTPLPSETQT